jgi:hypothetical protein
MIEEFNPRAIEAQRECRTTYADTLHQWRHRYLRGRFESVVRGKSVLEVGPGYCGGLADLARECGATGYLGVDINPAAVRSAKSFCREHQYVCDDPVHAIMELQTEHVIVSSAVFDPIIMSPQYGDRLVRSIYEHMSPGSRTMHWAAWFGEYFAPTFVQAGLRSLEKPTIAFGIFEKLEGAQ